MPTCMLLMIFAYLDTSQHIGAADLHKRMFAYVLSAYINVGQLCISLHTALCHAVNCPEYSGINNGPEIKRD